ncbi:MAG: amidohydrolase family protein, partial [Acidobacteriota bacterium]
MLIREESVASSNQFTRVAVASIIGVPRAKSRFAETLTFFVALVICGCTVPTPAPEEAADLVLRNGKVVTVNQMQPTAEALAIRGAWIVGVGSNEEMEAWVDAETEVMDLDGRMVIPGFIEGHGHFMDLGNAMTILDLSEAENWEEIVSMVGRVASQAEPG